MIKKNNVLLIIISVLIITIAIIYFTVLKTSFAVGNENDFTEISDEYNLFFQKIDPKTKNELDDWKIYIGSNTTLTNDYNQIKMKKIDTDVYRTYDKNNNILNFAIINGIFNLKIMEDYYTLFEFSAYPFVSSDNTERIDNKLSKICQDQKCIFEKIDDNNGLLKVIDFRPDLSISLSMSYFRTYGKSALNNINNKYEWKIFNRELNNNTKLDVVFEITLEDIKQGTFELENANEGEVIINNNKGTFTKSFDFESDYHTLKIKYLPFNTRYSLKILSQSINDESISLKKDETIITDRIYPNFNSVSFYAREDLTNYIESDILNKNYLNLKITKNVNSSLKEDKEKEHEFTIMPLYGYIIDAKHKYHIPLLNDTPYKISLDPELLYLVWLHGDEGDKVIDKNWFAKYSKYLLQLTIPIHKEEEVDKKLLSVFTGIEKLNIVDAGCVNGSFCYSDTQMITQMVNLINERTNNFFEYEGNRIIELSKKLKNELNQIGYNDTQLLFYDIGNEVQNESDEKKAIEIIENFIACFTKAGWTVDDFRFLRIMSIEGISSYKDNFNDSHFYEGWQNQDFFPQSTTKYFLGRTFKLKHGQSITLTLPLFFVYQYNALVLEKKTHDIDYKQDNSIMFVTQHKEDDGNDLKSNVVYDNSYEMFDVFFNKIDSNNQTISNVKMQLKDTNGNIVDTWTTSNERHQIKLSKGNYILEELSIPNNYIKNENIDFEITNDGSVIISNENITFNNNIINIINKNKDEDQEIELPPKNDDKEMEDNIEIPSKEANENELPSKDSDNKKEEVKNNPKTGVKNNPNILLLIIIFGYVLLMYSISKKLSL